MDRKPPAEVIRALRKEVGFGCPVPGCANPYLEWHHFDPPFHIRNHHNLEGMIALCIEHHKKADGGAYTQEQLRELKRNKSQAEMIKGQFDWLRNDLMAVVGGNFYYDTLKVLQLNDRDIVWFRRDDEGYLRLNVRMVSVRPEERAIIEDNVWMNIGNPEDVSSPPQGKELRIKYNNGDYLFVKFLIMDTARHAYEKYEREFLLRNGLLKFPLTIVEVNYKIGGTNIELNSSGTNIGSNKIIGGFSHGNGVGLKIDYRGLVFRENPSLLSYTPKFRLEQCPCGSGLRFKNCHGLLV